jgi:hypothetical protein
MWIQATNTGPGMFLLSVPTDDPNADYNPPIVFMDTGAIVALTNGTAPLITIGNWGSLAGTVMTNTLILNYPNGTFSYALNGQTMATMPLGPYFSNVVDSVTFTGFERSAGSLGNRFAISDVQVALSTSAQAQGQWAERVASTINTDDELFIGMSLDTNGNCYVTGWFDGTNNFGGVTLTNLSGGGQDIFVAKYNSTGALQWAHRAGGSTANRDAGRGIGVDTNGNVYVTGGFYGPADFGSSNLPATSYEEFFLAKYNSTGTVQWVQQSTGGVGTYGTGLAVDGAGNSYAVGVAYNGDGTIMFGTTNLINANTGDFSAFFVKYDNTGKVQWAQLMGGQGITYVTKVAVDAAENVYVCGDFTTSMTIGTSNLVNTGSGKSYFIAKFNNSGALTWVQQATGGGNLGEAGVAVDQAGNVYLGGMLQNTLNFGGISLTNAAASYNAFLAKYSNSGALQWVHQAGGTNGGAYADVALDRQGNVYTGAIALSPDSGAGVVKYDPAGTLQCAYAVAISWSPPASPFFVGVFKYAVDSATNCFLAGWYYGTNTFGTNVLQPQGYWNYFLAKVAAPSPPKLGLVLSNGIPRLSLTGSSSSIFSLQCSPTLVATNTPWQTLAMLPLTNSPQLYIDTKVSSRTNRFYRAAPPAL